MKKSMIVAFGISLLALPAFAYTYMPEVPRREPIFLTELPSLEELSKPNFYHVSYL